MSLLQHLKDTPVFCPGPLPLHGIDQKDIRTGGKAVQIPFILLMKGKYLPGALEVLPVRISLEISYNAPVKISSCRHSSIKAQLVQIGRNSHETIENIHRIDHTVTGKSVAVRSLYTGDIVLARHHPEGERSVHR